MVALVLAAAVAGVTVPQGAPSQYGVDAPELAALGEFAVGVRTLRLILRAQVDVSAFDSARGAPRRDRVLEVDVWYPAQAQPQAPRVFYTANFPAEPPGAPVEFSVPGIAVRDAAAARRGGAYPLVVVSHGYSNAPAAMTWLTENLASKGYVVAAIHHDDPDISDASKRSIPILRRPLDIAMVTRELRQKLGGERLIDPDRVALVGYSMGGYGVLTAAGAALDPAGPPTQLVPGGLLQPYARGGALRNDVLVEGVKAVVAISPAGGGTLAAWGSSGLKTITAPLLLISGDEDRTVDYASGAQAIFASALNSHRYLLTFKGGGHSIGLNPAPAAMRTRLWDYDWFEDPVWRKDRVNAINAHFITAFLDLYLKGDASRAAFLDVPVTDSSDGVWPSSVWKGFQRNHAASLRLVQSLPDAT